MDIYLEIHQFCYDTLIVSFLTLSEIPSPLGADLHFDGPPEFIAPLRMVGGHYKQESLYAPLVIELNVALPR